MTVAEARELPLGLYRIHWRDGGSSLAAVGQDHGGARWFAPTNWIADVYHFSSTSYGQPGRICAVASMSWELVASVGRIA